MTEEYTVSTRSALIVLALTLTTACSRTRATAATPNGRLADRTSRDSARGRIGVAGNDPGTWLIFQGSNPPVTLIGDRDLLEQMNGMYVVVFGRREPGNVMPVPGSTSMPGPGWTFYVDRVIARPSDGEPAYDGILRREATGDFLDTQEGPRLLIPHLPDALINANGLRVIIFGPLAAPTGARFIDPSWRAGQRGPRRPNVVVSPP
jgi:hypothetical protein